MDEFRPPIYYDNDKVLLKLTVASDLELVATVDPSNQPIYTYCFGDDVENNAAMAEYYTTNINFLKDMQYLVVSGCDGDFIAPDAIEWNGGYQRDNERYVFFCDKYGYLEYETFEFLNRSELFLQLIGWYNICSPLITLLTPLIMLIVPFIMLRALGRPVSVEEYVDALYSIASQHSIGRIFVTNFSTLAPSEAAHIVLSAAFYVYSIYRNICGLFKFRDNLRAIQDEFRLMSEYLSATIDIMKRYLYNAINVQSTAHEQFNRHLIRICDTLGVLLSRMRAATVVNNREMMAKLGVIMRCFYELRCDAVYDAAIQYSFRFNNYVRGLAQLRQMVQTGRMNPARFGAKTHKGTVLHDSYYPATANPVRNTIRFKKNMIITGPNAAGKTTILKSTLINAILTQQVGFGFYGTDTIYAPFRHIHSYINIPDTCGRDSLFQAEARRCAEILAEIEGDPAAHLCVFDELLSSTNPVDAVNSSVALMRQFKSNAMVMLSTHHTKVCDKLGSAVATYKMKSARGEDGVIVHTYRLRPGISRIRGGMDVITGVLLGGMVK